MLTGNQTAHTNTSTVESPYTVLYMHISTFLVSRESVANARFISSRKYFGKQTKTGSCRCVETRHIEISLCYYTKGRQRAFLLLLLFPPLLRHRCRKKKEEEEEEEEEERTVPLSQWFPNDRKERLFFP